MTIPIDTPTVYTGALARGVLCRALKLGFDNPGEALLEAFFSADGRDAQRSAARHLESGPPQGLTDAVERACSSKTLGLEPLTRAYARLFGHTLRGQVCPYECEYGRQALLMRSNELADLGGFYAAFGLRSSETRHERHDHVACEFEFLEFLSRKECWAIEHDDIEMAEVTAKAVGTFLDRHLARFGRAFARSVQQADPQGFYGGLGGLCEAFLLAECARLGVSIGPAVLELRSSEADNMPMACGSSDASQDELVHIGGVENRSSR